MSAPWTPFACPGCGMLSVAVGICPECRMELVARRQEAEVPLPAPVPAGTPAAVVHEGFSPDCAEVGRILSEAGIETVLVHAGETDGIGLKGRKARMDLFRVLVPAGALEEARRVLVARWEGEAVSQGLDPVTDAEALALEAESRCPACGDPCLPGAPACLSCGIALA